MAHFDDVSYNWRMIMRASYNIIRFNKKLLLKTLLKSLLETLLKSSLKTL